jgi:hypothetical protein
MKTRFGVVEGDRGFVPCSGRRFLSLYDVEPIRPASLDVAVSPGHVIRTPYIEFRNSGRKLPIEGAVRNFPIPPNTSELLFYNETPLPLTTLPINGTGRVILALHDEPLSYFPRQYHAVGYKSFELDEADAENTFPCCRMLFGSERPLTQPVILSRILTGYAPYKYFVLHVERPAVGNAIELRACFGSDATSVAVTENSPTPFVSDSVTVIVRQTAAGAAGVGYRLDWRLVY